MRSHLASLALLALLPSAASAAADLPAETITATVLIANYNEAGRLTGWGSGFFVDEGIVVTNKHVIQAGHHYRVYGTAADGNVDFQCFRELTKSDVKISLEDDVAYMRAYLSCDHGVMDFAEDPLRGDPAWVLGFPYDGSPFGALHLTVTAGEVLGREDDGWIQTDAAMDVGNSGGPVINDSGVLGVAVAKGVDDDGNYVVGLFIASSVILDGLLYANDPDFAYTPRSRSSVSRASPSASFAVSSRPSSSSVKSSPASSARSSRVSSSVRASVSPLQERTCKRAAGYRVNAGVFKRLNERLMSRYGFRCR